MSFQLPVSNIINRVGTGVTYRSTSSSVYNVASGVNSPTYTDYPVKAFIRNYSPKEIAGLIQQGDREVRIAAMDLTILPKPTDKITIAGKDFVVLSVNIMYPHNVATLFIIQVRG